MKRYRQILKRDEVVDALKNGDYILWIGGANFNACLGSDWTKTIRHDTILKLWREGLITDFGFPQLNGKIYWKQKSNSDSPQETSANNKVNE